MTQAEIAYWGALAQVIPVLGVGLVLEIRFLASRPLFRSNKGYRRVYSVVWTLAAMCIALGLNTALNSLRTDQSPGPVSDLTTRAAVIYAVFAVLLSPVVDLIMTRNSDLLGRLLAASPTRWLLLRTMRRNARQLGVEIGRARSLVFETLSHLDGMREMYLEELRKGEEVKTLAAGVDLEKNHELKQVVDRVNVRIQVARAELAEVTTRREETLLRWRSKIREENNYWKWREYALPRILDAVKEDVSLLAGFLAASQVAQAEGGTKPVYLPASQITDEVGFIIDVPPRPLALWRNIPYFVRDAKEFEELESLAGDSDPPGNADW